MSRNKQTRDKASTSGSYSRPKDEKPKTKGKNKGKKDEKKGVFEWIADESAAAREHKEKMAEIRQGGRSDRTATRQGNRTARQEEKTYRTEARQQGRADRTAWRQQGRSDRTASRQNPENVKARQETVQQLGAAGIEAGAEILGDIFGYQYGLEYAEAGVEMPDFGGGYPEDAYDLPAGRPQQDPDWEQPKDKKSKGGAAVAVGLLGLLGLAAAAM